MDNKKTFSELKKEARERMVPQQRNILLMAIIPTILSILSLFVSSSSMSAIKNTLLIFNNFHFANGEAVGFNTNIYSTNFVHIIANIFGLLIFFTTTALTWRMIDVFRRPKETKIKPFADITDRLSSPDFAAIVKTGFSAWLFMLLWCMAFIIVGVIVLVFAFAYANQADFYNESADLPVRDPAFYSSKFVAHSLPFLLGIVLLIVALIVLVIKKYSYSLAMFIVHDELERGGDFISLTYGITASKVLTKGYRWRLFLFDLSFILWWWLAMFSFGVAYIYVYPYYYLSKTAFYEEIIKERVNANAKLVQG